MAAIGRSLLLDLASNRAWPSLSILMPTHRAGANKDQDRIRLKNLRREMYERLVSQGLRAPDAEAALAPVDAVLEDPSFWRETTEGLALFSSERLTRTIKLDAPPVERALVGDRFYLRPLLPAHSRDTRFFALLIDRNGCRLYRGDAASIVEIALEGAPASLAEELRYDEVQQAVQYSSVPASAKAAGGGRPTNAIFHGHGGEKDTDKANLERYLRKVEAAASAAVAKDADVPLILFGVDYELAVYRALNTSQALVDEQVLGATDELTPRDVQVRALEALEPSFRARLEARLEALVEARGNGRVTNDPASIVPAAAAGRIEDLFIDDGYGPFGTFDRERFIVDSVTTVEPEVLRESPGPADGSGPTRGWDLGDLAAAEVLLHGGRVHAFAGNDAPIRGMEALLRY